MHNVSPAQRRGRSFRRHSVRRQRVRHIDGTPPEHPHNARRREAGRQPACSKADVDAERHVLHTYTCFSNVSHRTGLLASEPLLILLLDCLVSARCFKVAWCYRYDKWHCLFFCLLVTNKKVEEDTQILKIVLILCCCIFVLMYQTPTRHALLSHRKRYFSFVFTVLFMSFFWLLF